MPSTLNEFGQLVWDGSSVPMAVRQSILQAIAALAQQITDMNGDANGNIRIGTSALQVLASGENNIAIGVSSLAALLNGSDVIALGESAMAAATTASDTVSIGERSGSLATQIASSVIIGDAALLQPGTYNLVTVIGKGAATTSTPGARSILIGPFSETSGTNLNEIVIGYGAVGNGANTTTIGNAQTVLTYLLGAIVLSKPILLASYTNAGLPAASSYTGGTVYVSDDVNGGNGAISNGTDWKRVVTAGSVTLTTTRGAVITYLPSANTDAARGASLIAAITAHAAGDSITVGPGTYDTGTTQMTMLAGSSLIGSGQRTTILKLDKHTNNFVLNSNVTFQDLKAICMTPSNSSGHSMFGNTVAAYTNVQFINCWLVGQQDIFNGAGGFNNTTLRLVDCRLETMFDTFNWAGGTTGCVLDLENCTIIAQGVGNPDPSAGLANLVCVAGVTINSRQCRFITGDAGGGGAGTCAVATGGELNLIDPWISVNSGGNDIFQTSSGTINVTNGRGSGTSGAFITLGVITYLGGTVAPSPSLLATNGGAPTVASATTIAPTKRISFISGTASITTITAPSPISQGGGTLTFIPTGIFSWGTGGNIALGGTAVVSKALEMTYDLSTAKFYPSYV